MNAMNQDVHLALSGRITFEQDISVAQAAQVIGMLQAPLGLDPPSLSHEPLALPPSSAPRAEEEAIESPAPEKTRRTRLVESPRQALELSGAKTYPEKITTFAAYLLQEEDRETFTQSDIRRLFQRSRDRIPTHFSREFDKAVRAGWIHEGEVKGDHYVSEAAKDILETGFSDVRSKRGGKRGTSVPTARGSGRRKPRSVPVPDAFADLDDIPSTIDGIVPYHRVRLKRDKLLWVLKLAKDLGIEGLQGAEAAWLADKLGDAIPTRDMNGHFTGLRRLGYANRSMSDSAMRITQQGEEYLESLQASP
ncbi:hypothetical protein ACFC0D_36035 [Streptomyces sp. NPDC056222]|uniref:hypothetical protein n=1 Tax=Streptomyces sp. NPDC056222 TaxID=3345749 RepID=UPI0035D5BBE4